MAGGDIHVAVHHQLRVDLQLASLKMGRPVISATATLPSRISFTPGPALKRGGRGARGCTSCRRRSSRVSREREVDISQDIPGIHCVETAPVQNVHPIPDWTLGTLDWSWHTSSTRPSTGGSGCMPWATTTSASQHPKQALITC